MFVATWTLLTVALRCPLGRLINNRPSRTLLDRYLFSAYRLRRQSAVLCPFLFALLFLVNQKQDANITFFLFHVPFCLCASRSPLSIFSCHAKERHSKIPGTSSIDLSLASRRNTVHPNYLLPSAPRPRSEQNRLINSSNCYRLMVGRMTPANCE